MTIFFYKGLTRNPEIRNTSVWVLPNIWRLGQIRDTKCTNVFNKILMSAAKCQGYSFYRFWVIMGKPTWVGKLPPPLSPPMLGSNTLSLTACKTLWKTTDSASIDNWHFFPNVFISCNSVASYLIFCYLYLQEEIFVLSSRK